MSIQYLTEQLYYDNMHVCICVSVYTEKAHFSSLFLFLLNKNIYCEIYSFPKV